ncbi:hypothetical protein [Rubneribacter badeniensis]|uniref:hypothetical protein n=1 Tax=Rubneribacter badeniensis TaxID=2070688 RepID=UPI003A946E6A
MQDSNARTVRGIGIAVVILSALALIVFGLGAIAVGALGAFVSDPSLYGDGISINGYDHGYYDSLSAEEAAGLMSGSMLLVTWLFVWGALCAAVSLVAGILGIRVPTHPDKSGSAFGWSIAGAIVAVLSGRLVTAVLLVIAAVYANKLRHPEPSGYQPQQPYGQPWGQQPGYSQQPWNNQQPYGQQPGYGYGTPNYPQPADAAGASAADTADANTTGTPTATHVAPAAPTPAAPAVTATPAAPTAPEDPIASKTAEDSPETEDSAKPESDGSDAQQKS